MKLEMIIIRSTFCWHFIIFANQDLSDAKKSSVIIELQKLVSEWPAEVIKHQKEENKKVDINIFVFYNLCLFFLKI